MPGYVGPRPTIPSQRIVTESQVTVPVPAFRAWMTENRQLRGLAASPLDGDLNGDGRA